jgi:hypothetical protein
MGDTFAISALHRKRARLAGQIEAAERAIASQRETLATLDAVIRLFEPSNPELIPAIRPYSKRALFFRNGEQSRLCLSALRARGGPMSCRQVADFALAAKGLELDWPLREQVTKSIRSSLTRLAASGSVRKIVAWPDTWWELVI